MQAGDFVLPLAILIWAAFEYHRREQDHREVMVFLQRGLQPPPRSDSPQPFQLWTAGGVALLLIVLSIGLVWLAFSGSILYGSGALIVLAVPFVSMAILLLLIVRRDRRILKQQKA